MIFVFASAQILYYGSQFAHSIGVVLSLDQIVSIVIGFIYRGRWHVAVFKAMTMYDQQVVFV